MGKTNKINKKRVKSTKLYTSYIHFVDNSYVNRVENKKICTKNVDNYFY